MPNAWEDTPDAPTTSSTPVANLQQAPSAWDATPTLSQDQADALTKQGPSKPGWEWSFSPVDATVAGLHNYWKGLEGATQLVEHGMDSASSAILGNDSSVSKYLHKSTTSDDQILKNWENDYQANWPDSPATYAGAVVGNALMPINRLIPMGRSGYLMTALKGSGQGAISGATSAETSGDSDNFWTNKAGQTAFGLGAGAALSPISKALGDYVIQPAASKIGAWVSALRSGASDMSGQANGAVFQAAHQNGIDVNSIPQDAMDGIKAQVAKAMSNGENLDVPALLRKAQFDAVGVDPMLGQVTRDPLQYTRELDLRGVPGGEPIATRLNDQNKALVSVLQNNGAGTAPSAYAAGTQVMKNLVSGDTARSAAVDAAYAAVRDSQGRAMGLDPSKFSGAVNDRLDQGMMGAELPDSVRTTMNQISQGDIPFNVNTALQWDKILSAKQASSEGTAKAAIQVVRNELQNAVPAGTPGADTQALYKTAQGLARQRFQMLDQNPGLKAAVEGSAPEDFVNNYILKGKVNDVQNLMDLSGDEGQTIKQQVVAWLQNKALNGSPAEYGNFSSSAYNKALGSLGPEKTAAIFNQNEIGQLNNLRDVSAYIQNQPKGSSVNNSNTAAAIAQLAGKVKGIPWVSDYVAKPVVNAANASQAKAATTAQIKPSPASYSAALRLMNSIGVGPAAQAAADQVNNGGQ